MTSAARQRAELTSQITALLAVMPPGVDEVTAFSAMGQAARNISPAAPRCWATCATIPTR